MFFRRIIFVLFITHLLPCHSDSFDELFDKASMHIHKKEYKSAELIYRNILSEDAENIRALRSLGNIFFLKKKYDIAEDYFLKAIVVGDVISVRSLCGMYILQSKFDKITKYFPVLKENKNDHVDFFKFGLIYCIKMGLKAEYEKLIVGVDANILNDAEVKELMLVASRRFE